MRLLTILALTSLTLAAEFTPFQRSSLSTLKRQTTTCASIGEVVCGSSCMPPGSACCDADGDYCRVGNYCVAGGGCCPAGETCTGTNTDVDTRTINVSGSATAAAAGSSARATATAAASSSSSSSSSSGSCRAAEIECGDGCLPLGYTCCPDQSGGCRTASEVCYAVDGGGYGCCDIGKTCRGGSGGAAGTTAIPSLASTVRSSAAYSATVRSSAAGSTLTATSASGSTAPVAPTVAGGTVPAAATPSIARAEGNVIGVAALLPAMAMCGLVFAQVLL